MRLLMVKNILMLESKPKSLKKNLMFLGFIFLVALFFLNISISYLSNNDNKYLIKETKRINSQLERFKEENKRISEKIAIYENMLVKIDSNISINESKIDKLKISTNEKINSFKSYDARMWEKFFADRYSK